LGYSKVNAMIFTALIKELLTIGLPETSNEILELVEAMDEVVERQWNTYSLLDSETRRALDEWVQYVWDNNFPKLVRRLISIIAKAGLTQAYIMMCQELHGDLSPTVRREIMDAIIEFGSNIDDPFSGMEPEEPRGVSPLEK